MYKLLLVHEFVLLWEIEAFMTNYLWRLKIWLQKLIFCEG